MTADATLQGRLAAHDVPAGQPRRRARRRGARGDDAGPRRDGQPRLGHRAHGAGRVGRAARPRPRSARRSPSSSESRSTAASTARSSSIACRRRCRPTGHRCCRCATRRCNSTDPLTIRLARAGMKRFYPEASVEVIGAVDPAYVDFLASSTASRTSSPVCRSATACAPTVFYPRGWMLRRDPRQPMADDDTLLIEEEEVPRIGATLTPQVSVRTKQRRPELALGRSQQNGRPRRGAKRSALRRGGQARHLALKARLAGSALSPPRVILNRPRERGNFPSAPDIEGESGRGDIAELPRVERV